VPYRRFQNRWWLHILLFLLTVATTTAAGLEYYYGYVSALGTREVAVSWPLIGHATIYAGAILAILGAHEMGHYLACRYYGVDCTLPFFIPVPTLSGTAGAMIRIREGFPSRRILFDIGIAGPIAGFLVLVPVLAIAMYLSTLVQAPPPPAGAWYFGEPLLFKAMTWLKFGSVSDAYQLNLHPIGFAAWFGMLATAWNLLPFTQLDGGHLSYAALGDRSRHVSVATATAAVAMCFVSATWILMTLLMLAALYFFGPDHPRPLNDDEPLDGKRYALLIFAMIMFALCFTPIPVRFQP